MLKNIFVHLNKTDLRKMIILVGLVTYFNAELSPKRYWPGPRSQEVGEEGDYTWHYTVTTRMTPALRWAERRAILTFHRGPSAYEPNVTKTVSMNNNF